ncbi:hypothetical protein PIB30_089086, partial [Stylosanthes scabra]|nr:hypothetical protein [Stylosanthes scabra]
MVFSREYLTKADIGERDGWEDIKDDDSATRCGRRRSKANERKAPGTRRMREMQGLQRWVTNVR